MTGANQFFFFRCRFQLAGANATTSALKNKYAKLQK